MSSTIAKPVQPTRKRIRLLGYDYALPGAYFSTICTFKRRLRFGRIVDGEMVLTPLGQLVADEITALPTHYPGYLLLDQWVVMPNHVHLILFFVRPIGTPIRPEGEAPVPRIPNLSDVMRHFKAGVTSKARKAGLLGPTEVLWQDRFHDHVIRHERALERVQEYVVNNPRQWELDRENAGRRGEHEFYRWIEAYTRELKRSEPIAEDSTPLG